MRARFGLGLVVSQWILGACALTTDFDNLSSGGVRVGDDGGGGGDASRDGEPPTLTSDAGPNPTGTDARATDGSVSTYGDLVLADKPAAYFPFDEPQGAPLITEKISGKSAVATTAFFTSGAPGIAGTSLAATGEGDMELGDTLDVVGGSPWTIEAWIKPELAGDKIFYEFFNKRQNSNNGIVAYVRHEGNDTTVQVEQSFAGGGRGVSALLGPLDHFFHIVFVYDPGQTGMRVWVDGKVSSKGYEDPGGPTDHDQPVRIASGVRGWIDELAVYTAALPADRILAHYAAGKQP